MSTKIAVAIIHGIGEQEEGFEKEMVSGLRKFFRQELRGEVEDPDFELVIEPVWWARALTRDEERFHRTVQGQDPETEEEFRESLSLEKQADNESVRNAYAAYRAELEEIRLSWRRLRSFIIRSGADAIAYQPMPGNRNNYDRIHDHVGQHLHDLARRAGDDAPLCIVAHSLGTVIASNYIWDLEHHDPDAKHPHIAPETWARIDTPLERGDTLMHLYTLGSPLALWGLRWSEDPVVPFGRPIDFPPQNLLDAYKEFDTEWVNFYDKDDVIAYPLRPLNRHYRNTVDADYEVNVGNLFESGTPASHLHYWRSAPIQEHIAKAIAQTWRHVNGKA